MNKQRKFILISAAIGVISIFLPWVTISVMGMGSSVNGFHGVGIVVFLSFAGAIIIALMGDQTKSLDKTMWLAALAAGVIAFLFTLIAAASNDASGGMGLVDASLGIGIWLAFISSIGISASAWMFKNPDDDLKSSFEGLKAKTMSSVSSHSSSKVDELEKLIELRNQGKISEQEFQEMKAKLI